MKCETCQGTELKGHTASQFFDDPSLVFLPVMKNDGHTIWTQCQTCNGVGIDHCCGGEAAHPERHLTPRELAILHGAQGDSLDILA